ncbi:MAG: tyrosine-type recombinase/integrase [Bacteroidia bacterium]
MITPNKLESHSEAFRRYLEDKGYTPRTAETYVNALKRFLEANPWGDEYKYRDIVDYFGRLKGTHRKLETRKGILTALKRYYEYMVYTRQRKDHPCGGFVIKGGRDRGTIPSDLFTMEELEQLMDRTEDWGKQPQRNKLIYSLYIYQALSTEEIYRLALDDVDIDKGTITIKGTRRRNARVLEMNPRQFGLIYAYLHEERVKVSKKNSPPVFILNQYGNASSHDSIVDSLLPVTEAFPGRHIGAMSIRQSVMSHWVNVRKIPIEEAQLLAGMRWVSSIERYQHMSGAEEQDVLKKFHPLG